MNPTNLKSVIEQIDLKISSAREGKNFVFDKTVSDTARVVFHENLKANSSSLNLVSLKGLVSIIGFGAAACAVYSSPLLGFGLLVTSIAYQIIYVRQVDSTVSKLRDALKEVDEETIIKKISEGADIHQMIISISSATLRRDLPFLDRICCSKRNLTACYSRIKKLKVVTYLFMLETNPRQRINMIFRGIKNTDDLETIRLLMSFEEDPEMKVKIATAALKCVSNTEKITTLVNEFGARPHEIDPMLLYLFYKDEEHLEVLRLYRDNAVPFDSGISDYEKWEKSIKKELTPLEYILQNKCSEPASVLDAMLPNSKIYKDPKTAEELYKALNDNGLRVRRCMADQLFQILNSELTNI